MRILSILIVLLMVSQCAWAASSRGKTTLKTFDYRNVRLNEGLLAEHYERTKGEYLAIPDDGLLKGFRSRAGFPAPGPDMGGWYDRGEFHMFGQLLSGLARFYAGSGDEACRRKADFLISEWSKCIAPDGFFFNTPEGLHHHYVYEKMVCGLIDNYLYCENEEALESLSRITDWAMENLSRNHSAWDSEWYTMSENLYRAFLATGQQKYYDFAKAFEYTDYWDLYAQGKDIFATPPVMDDTPMAWFHAYSHTNTLSSAAAAYEVTGDEHYLRTIENAYTYFQNTQVFATGGFGPIEMLAKSRKDLAGSLNHPYFKKHFETQCGSWAVLKLCKYLMRFTGEAQYGDWVEKVIYNGLVASPPMSPMGCVMYDSDYHPGGACKFNTAEPWTCCSGTRSKAIADLVDQLYFYDNDNIYINIFTPSQVEWTHERTKVQLVQQTDFPNSDRINLKLSMDAPLEFGLRFRKPDWIAGAPTATVNGTSVQLEILDTGWIGINRRLDNGDVVSITVPQQLHVSRIDPEQRFPAAVVHGPVVLAVDCEGLSPADRIDTDNIDQSLLPIPGEPLHFRVIPDGSPTLLGKISRKVLPLLSKHRDEWRSPTPGGADLLMMKPFYEFEAGERYYLYLDPVWTNIVSPHHFQFGGKWTWGVTEEIGAWAEVEFEGTCINWTGASSEQGGRAQVMLDEEPVAVVNQYGAEADHIYTWERKGLKPGKHKFRITLLEENNPASSGHQINVGTLTVTEASNSEQE